MVENENNGDDLTPEERKVQEDVERGRVVGANASYWRNKTEEPLPITQRPEYTPRVKEEPKRIDPLYDLAHEVAKSVNLTGRSVDGIVRCFECHVHGTDKVMEREYSFKAYDSLKDTIICGYNNSEDEIMGEVITDLGAKFRKEGVHLEDKYISPTERAVTVRKAS